LDRASSACAPVASAFLRCGGRCGKRWRATSASFAATGKAAISVLRKSLHQRMRAAASAAHLPHRRPLRLPAATTTCVALRRRTAFNTSSLSRALARSRERCKAGCIPESKCTLSVYKWSSSSRHRPKGLTWVRVLKKIAQGLAKWPTRYVCYLEELVSRGGAA